jgi:cell division protein FtsQ
MEIKTGPKPREEEAAEALPREGAEKGRYLRRKSPQKLRRSQSLGRSIARVLPAVGKALLFVGLLAFVVSIFGYAYTSDKFRVETIVVMGAKQAKADRIEVTIRKSIPTNLLLVDLAKVRAVAERDPWVRRAEVRRVLPSTLVVYIQERVPAALLELQGELHLADGDGVLLDRYDSKGGKLDVPVFKGLLGDSAANYRSFQEENATRVRLGRRMIEELETGSPAFGRSISEVDLSEESNVRILLVDDTAEISLGDRDFLKRFRTLMSNLSQYQELRGKYAEIASIDLRFDGQIIYRPRKLASPGTPGASAATGAPAEAVAPAPSPAASPSSAPARAPSIPSAAPSRAPTPTPVPAPGRAPGDGGGPARLETGVGKVLPASIGAVAQAADGTAAKPAPADAPPSKQASGEPAGKPGPETSVPGKKSTNDQR